jgi:CelD/BcsL family acetyltransferase involved in cellulose biosynthesis
MTTLDAESKMVPENSHSDAGFVEVLSSGEARQEIREAWRDLAISRENPFLTPEWAEAWEEGAGEELHALVWRRRAGAEVGAVLPLVAGRRGPLRTLRFPGAGNGDWFGAACAPEDEPGAIRELLAALREGELSWDVLRLDRVEAADVWREGIAAVWGARSPRIPRADDVLPFIDLGEDGYEGWLASRSRNFRSQLGRRRRRAEREHEVRFHDTPDAGGLGEAIDSLFELHDRRRLDAGGEGRLDAGAREAYRLFALASLERGWLRMHSVEVDGETAAAWYGWRIGRRYCYGMSGFEARWGELAIGTLLMAHTIERAAAEGAEIYDLLWGDEDYKSRYESGRRTVRTVAVAAGAIGRAALAGESSARSLAARLGSG